MKWTSCNSQGRPGLTAWLLAAALAASVGTAKASFLPAFTGNTQMSDAGASVGGVVDFAVYQNPAGDNWVNDLGLTSAVSGSSAGGGSVDTGASFVYFYEVVNTAPNAGDGTIAHFNIGNTDTPFSSGGWLRGYVFNDAHGKAVGPSTNPFLGPAASGDDLSNSQPSNSGVNLGDPPFTNSGVSPTDPTGVASLGGTGSQGTATFLWTILFGNALIGQNSYSPVLFFTSDKSPVYGLGTISDASGLNPSDGGIPSQAPEPTTLFLWSMGAFGCLASAKLAQAKAAAGRLRAA